MPRPFRIAAVLGFAASAVFAWACASQTNGDCSATQVGSACSKDSDCCSGYCKNYPDVQGAFCQAKVANPPKETAGTFCTQDSHCESGLCNGGTCFGTPPLPGTCDELGSQCIADSACCTGFCMPGTKRVCGYPSGFDAGSLQCGVANASCVLQSDCCSGYCAFNKCAAKPTGGGGGGNCGKAGAFCKSGIDCCSGQCSKLGSGSTQCR